MMEMISVLVKVLGWTSALLIYDKRSANMFADISSSLPPEMRMIVVDYDSQPDIVTPLQQMDTTQNHHHFNVIMMCSIDCILTVLNQSDGYEKNFDSFTSFKHRSRWLIIMEELNESVFYNSSLDHITVINPRQFEKLNYSSDPTKIDADFHQLMWRSGRQREFSKLSLNCLELSEDVVFQNLKYTLNGIHFRVGSKEWAPFVHKHTLNNGDIIYTGLCIDILDLLSSHLNFTYSIYFPPDNEWGRLVSGEWTGLIRMLQRKEVEMIVAAIGVSQEREQVMDFTFPYLFNRGIAMFRQRDSEDEKWLTLIKPFTWKVLLCIGVSLVGAAFIFHFIEIINPFYLTSPKDSFWRRLEYLYGAMLAHGSSNEPEAMAGRIFLGCWWIFCIILAASYSGTLIATLTVNKEKLPFNTLSELVNQDDYTWGTVSQTLFVPLFSKTTDPVFKQIWRGIVKENKTNPNVLSADPEIHRDLMLNSHYVFLMESSFYDKWASQNCEIKKIKEKYFSMDFSVGLQNNSAYTRQISHMTLRVLESNLMEIWKKKWWPSGKCKSSTQTMSTVIDIASLQSVFYFLFVGLFPAAVTLCVEIISFSSRRNTKLIGED